MENLLPMGAQRPSFLLVMLFLALLGGSWFQCQVRQGAALHRSSTHSLSRAAGWINTGGAAAATVPNRFEPPGLLTRVRAVHAVQAGDGQLRVHHHGVVPRGLPLHVQGQILPRPFTDQSSRVPPPVRPCYPPPLPVMKRSTSSLASLPYHLPAYTTPDQQRVRAFIVSSGSLSVVSVTLVQQQQCPYRTGRPLPNHSSSLASSTVPTRGRVVHSSSLHLLILCPQP
ncbi:hypothetical protein SAY87_019657 [Trapa incisa]|uniref:Uncharacterized protein n=1 Tax=Trapa incisa TaxID=236973 RepID=A0AAN7Q2H0_9MYRT|nr:hypothetical protein SAY87_019657 [Trapa incisa]